MTYITIIVLLVGFVVNSTTANVIPASILHCVNKFALDCPGKHKDFYCLCGKRRNFLKCLADSSAYGNFLEARDHYLGTCIEHIPDLSKHPDFNLELQDQNEGEYSSFPFPSPTLVLSSITSIETSTQFNFTSSISTSTVANSTEYVYPSHFPLNSSFPYSYQGSTMSILPIEEPIRNEQPEPTAVPFIPPLGPLTPPFYDIGRECECECKCDEFNPDCDNKDIEHCIYKCISEKYDDEYDWECDGDDDIDGNDDHDDDYDYDYEDCECKFEDQKDCLYDDENTVIEYFKYKQAFLSLPKIDQQNGNINEESAKFWNEEKKARNDILKEFSQKQHQFQQAESDLKNKNNKNENENATEIETETENKKQSVYNENSKDFQNLSHDKIKEKNSETKQDFSGKDNLTSNAIEFKFATPDIMFGDQNPVIREKQLKFKKPDEKEEPISDQSFRKRKNRKAKHKKKYFKKAKVNTNSPDEGGRRIRFASPNLDSSEIPKEQPDLK